MRPTSLAGIVVALAIIAAASPLLSAPAAAQGDGARAAEQAKAEYESGMRAYDRGDFERAIEAFARAYELDPAPMLLFNLAQAHRKKGDSERALSLYRRYLEADPRSEHRARVEAHILALA